MRATVRDVWWGTDYDGKRYRYSWEESAPCWPTELRDKDRRQELGRA